MRRRICYNNLVNVTFKVCPARLQRKQVPEPAGVRARAIQVINAYREKHGKKGRPEPCPDGTRSVTEG